MQLSKFFLFLLLLISHDGWSSQVNWHGALWLNDSISLPIRFYTNNDAAFFICSTDTSPATVEKTIDSTHFYFQNFDAHISVLERNDSLIGFFYNNSRAKQQSVPCWAKKGIPLLAPSQFHIGQFNGKWEAHFTDDSIMNSAVAILNQIDNKVTATFLTPTGDFRFIEGYVDGDQLYMWAFDASHLFVFTAELQSSDTLIGNFYSGTNHQEKWRAIRNDQFKLVDEYALTQLKSENTVISFSLPDTNGIKRSIMDSEYKGKPLVIQLMGTWCPNCLDEIKTINQLYDQYSNLGVKFIGIDFERKNDFQYAKSSIIKLTKRLNIKYPILFGGLANKALVPSVVLGLENFVAFPTTIFIDASGAVMAIHSGFNGPATGDYHLSTVARFKTILNRLVNR
ncbi:MAG: hypothetical protein RIQ89_571 [Bacteroidota bacterium]|jgi:thiol-disulfide isomerase/thioredoxin